MAIGDDFKNFIHQRYTIILDNLNLTDDLLRSLKAASYIQPSYYFELKAKTSVYDRNLRFLDILDSQPADYRELNKTDDLIKILGDRRHPRESVQKVFIEWRNLLLSSAQTEDSPAAFQGTRETFQKIPDSSLNPQPQPQSTILPASGCFPGWNANQPGTSQQTLNPLHHPQDLEVYSEANSEQELISPESPRSEVVKIRAGSSSETAAITKRRNTTQTSKKINNLISESSFIKNFKTGNVTWFRPELDKLVKYWPKLESETDLIKQLQELSAKPSAKYKKGLTFHLNWWDFDDPGLTNFKCTQSDVGLVKHKFKELTTETVQLYCRIHNLDELNEAIAAIKTNFDNDYDYLVGILSSYGCNGTQLYLKQQGTCIDIFQHVICELDGVQVDNVQDVRPRVYLVNTWDSPLDENLPLDAAQVPLLKSPFFVAYSTVPQEVAFGNKKGTFFLKTVCTKFQSGVNLFHLMDKVQKSIAAQKIEQKTSIYVGNQFPLFHFKFTGKKNLSRLGNVFSFPDQPPSSSVPVGYSSLVVPSAALPEEENEGAAYAPQVLPSSGPLPTVASPLTPLTTDYKFSDDILDTKNGTLPKRQNGFIPTNHLDSVVHRHYGSPERTTPAFRMSEFLPTQLQKVDLLQPAQVEGGNGYRRLWLSLLQNNREDLLRRLEIRNAAQLQALANRGCIDQKELIEINNQPEVVMTQRVHVFLDILARRPPPNWQMLTNIIEAFTDPLNPAAANIFRNIRNDMFQQA